VNNKIDTGNPSIASGRWSRKKNSRVITLSQETKLK